MEISQGGGDEMVGITRLWKECTVKIYEESWRDCEMMVKRGF